jgi:hypothetical protein
MKIKIIALVVVLIAGYKADAQWQPVNAPYGGNILSIHVDGNDIYTSTDYSFYYSNNCGHFWIERKSIHPFGNIDQIVSSDNIIYAVCNYSNVIFSQDKGLSWQYLTHHSKDTFIRKIYSNGKLLFALKTVNTKYQLYKISLPDTIWTRVDTFSNLCSVFPLNDTDIYITTLNNKFYKSTDGGHNWKNINIGYYHYPSEIKVVKKRTPNDTDITFIGTSNNVNNWEPIIYSKNDSDWKPIQVFDSSQYFRFMDIKDSIIAAFIYNDLYISLDFGTSWKKAPRNELISNINTLHCIAITDFNILLGSMREGIFKFNIRKNQWVKSDSGICDLYFRSIKISPRIITLLVYVDGEYFQYISEDGGINWIFHPEISNMVIGNDNLIIKQTYYSDSISFDDGLHYNKFVLDSSSNLGSYNAIIKFADRLLLATDHGLFISFDYGKTWKRDQNELNNLGIVSLVIPPANFKQTTLYAAVYCHGIYSSIDSGLNWVKLTDNYFSTDIQGMQINNSSICVLQNLKKLSFSNDLGLSWEKYSDSNYIYSWIALDNYIIKGTQNGIFYSTYPYTSWNSINDNLEHNYYGFTPVNGIDYINNSLFVIAGNKIWKRPISDLTKIDKEQKGTMKILLYPNPCKDKITIKTSSFTKPVSVEILDVTGRVIISGSYNQAEAINLDVAICSSGLHFIRLISGTDIYSGKFIKE